MKIARCLGLGLLLTVGGCAAEIADAEIDAEVEPRSPDEDMPDDVALIEEVNLFDDADFGGSPDDVAPDDKPPADGGVDDALSTVDAPAMSDRPATSDARPVDATTVDASGPRMCVGSASGQSSLWTCTADLSARQRCVSERVETEACPRGCTRHAAGENDTCAAAPPSCRRTTGPFTWSCDGPIAGQHCVALTEPADPDGWSNNYLCSPTDLGVRWSNAGPVPGMRCTAIIEPREPAPHAWSDNYLCVPTSSTYTFVWARSGPIAGRTCLPWNEPQDPHDWGDNYLCWVSAPRPAFRFPTPIEHVVVIVKENHTFDSMFMNFPGAASVSTALRANGRRVRRPRAPDGALPSDIAHSHHAAVLALHNGAMDRFDVNSERSTRTHDPLLAFAYYAERQIPNYWQYARNFVLCDHFFSALLGPSNPGHFALWTAQTPQVGNPDCTGSGCDEGGGCFSPSRATIDTINPNSCAIRHGARPCFDVPTVVDHLPSGLSWRVYSHPNARGVFSPPIDEARSVTRSRAAFNRHNGDIAALVADIRAGRLANVTYAHVGGAWGEHPPRAMCPGENFTVMVVNALMQSPFWQSTAVVFTYDDWGGFYDHVRPSMESCGNGDHAHLGFRLPLIVISPYSRRSHDPARPYVFHGRTEQASVPRLIEDLFDLPRMSAEDRNARDGRAGSLMGVFDFSHPDFNPLILPTRDCTP